MFTICLKSWYSHWSAVRGAELRWKDGPTAKICFVWPGFRCIWAIIPISTSTRTSKDVGTFQKHYACCVCLLHVCSWSMLAFQHSYIVKWHWCYHIFPRYIAAYIHCHISCFLHCLSCPLLHWWWSCNSAWELWQNGVGLSEDVNNGLGARGPVMGHVKSSCRSKQKWKLGARWRIC